MAEALIDINPPMVLVSDRPEFTPNKYNKTNHTDSICSNCPMLEACRKRVKQGLWLYCEIPCREDLLIVELRGR